MTYNIHHGEGVDGKLDLPRIAEVIKAQAPDLVALQEVDKGVARTDRVDTPAELARLTGMTALFHNNYAYQGGEYGNAILSRFPVVSESNTHLKMLREGEQRGVLQAVVELPGGRHLLFAATHIDYRRDDAERLQNIQEFKGLLGQYPALPFILCGDFNDFPNSRVHAAMKEDFVDSWEKVGEGDGFTFSSDRPRSRIDYVWVARRDSAPQPKRTWIPETQASDHLPLVFELELP
ncbi:MAG: endonuclease/exonuclease/phosphatase family protein [Verrucomicrobiales bacterium]|nr:endonuclease/exonuclease/phosphatase family protein [Verrucomicrobiales bacterium]